MLSSPVSPCQSSSSNVTWHWVTVQCYNQKWINHSQLCLLPNLYEFVVCKFWLQLAAIFMLQVSNRFNLYFIRPILHPIWHRLARAQHQLFFQSKSLQKSVNLFQKSSNPSRRGALGGTRCECVCTCGDPVPPKPVRRVMFSDDTSSPCSPCSCHKSLPPVPSASSSASCCCSPQCEAVQAGPEDAVPSNHYKSPHEVDGEYSYAYRWDNRSHPLIIITILRTCTLCFWWLAGCCYLPKYSWKC